MGGRFCCLITRLLLPFIYLFFKCSMYTLEADDCQYRIATSNYCQQIIRVYGTYILSHSQAYVQALAHIWEGLFLPYIWPYFFRIFSILWKPVPIHIWDPSMGPPIYGSTALELLLYSAQLASYTIRPCVHVRHNLMR